MHNLVTPSLNSKKSFTKSFTQMNEFVKKLKKEIEK